MIYPVAQCFEYSTIAGAGYVAHFGYFNGEGAARSFRADGSNNYFQPIPLTTGPSVFYPGYHPDVVSTLVPPGVNDTWHLESFDATIVTSKPSNPAQQTPVCPARFIPASVHLSQPGTYIHQYLGQVTAGPGPDQPGTYSLLAIASAGANLQVTNLTYVPGDSANPSNSLNPNSIYGDVNIGAAGAGSGATVDVQLSTNGTPVVEGIVSVQP
jgi:hypothetical protein